MKYFVPLFLDNLVAIVIIVMEYCQTIQLCKTTSARNDFQNQGKHS